MGEWQGKFLSRARDAAAAAGHIFPEYAACEAALESGWGLSQLATEANNLFGQKQAHPALKGTETVSLPTREYLHGAWTTVQASWIKFASWQACFEERMRLLRNLAATYPHYSAALAAKTGDEFIHEVSKSWSTDPQRAGKVLSVYDYHRAIFQSQVNAA
ncbi:MAG TPA: glucosaminidase domain-containing protein [Pseudacidobacterium sp.]|jgi:flagellum-specific peptidoglycan hydrolase FlgJ|nr:glucosaminidase domain-containing protein [Pseudacidobacterium sp.]